MAVNYHFLELSIAYIEFILYLLTPLCLKR